MDKSDYTRSVVLNYCEALASRKLDDILDLFAEKIDWYVAGDEAAAPWLGKRSTKAEILKFFTQLWANTAPLKAQIDHVLTEDDFGIVTGEFTTRMLQTDKVVNSLFSIHITLENGLIVRYRLQEDSHAVSEAMSN